MVLSPTFRIVILMSLFSRRRGLINEGNAGHTLTVSFNTTRCRMLLLIRERLLATLLEKPFGLFGERGPFFVPPRPVARVGPHQLPVLIVRLLRGLSGQAVRVLLAVRAGTRRPVVWRRQERGPRLYAGCGDGMKGNGGEDDSSLVASRQPRNGRVPGQARICGGPLFPRFIVSIFVTPTRSR